MANKLILRDVSKSFKVNGKDWSALLQVNLYVDEGEFVTIIGPSGSGKSTLFNIIAGISKESSGTIQLEGEEIKSRRGNFGYMHQKPFLLPWKTVKENVMLGLLIRGVEKGMAEKKACDLLETFDLSEFKNQYPATLSGGIAQRVAILRTILFNGKFLLMDEPFGSLDALTRLSMQMWLKKLLDELNSSMLFITHDIREAILLSDRIYVLSKRPGKIIKEFKLQDRRSRTREFLNTSTAIQIEKELEEMLLNI